MPNLNGKKYSYDAAGMAQYKEDLANMQMMRKGKEVYNKGGSFLDGFVDVPKRIMGHIQQNKPHLTNKRFTTIRDAAKIAQSKINASESGNKMRKGGGVCKTYKGLPKK